jgi:hypothetical protein
MEMIKTATISGRMQSILQELPDSLEAAYEHYILQIRSQPEEDRELAFNTLRWVAFAFRPLTFQELRYAVTIEANPGSIQGGLLSTLIESERLLQVCGGFLMVEKINRRACLIRKGIKFSALLYLTFSFR